MGQESEGFGERVAILLSTYNGARYIGAQIQSLLDQSYSGAAIFIRDDGSTDDTRQVICEFNSSRIRLVDDEFGNLGPAASFLQLLSNVHAEIYLFCDQDDFWLPHKLQEAVSVVSETDPLKPMLFHTDLLLADERLNKKGETFNQRQGIKVPGDYALSRLLIQNCVVGCTMAFNEALVVRSGIREEKFEARNVAMHDWWLTLHASCFGTVRYSDRPSLLYRQHSANVSGAGNDGGLIRRLVMRGLSSGISRIRRYRRRIGAQAEHFLRLNRDDLSDRDLAAAQGVALLNEARGFKGIFSCLRNRVWFRNWYMNAAFVTVALLSVFSKEE